MTVLGLHCCVGAFSSCSEQRLLFAVVHGLLTTVVSLAAECGLQARGLGSCGSQAKSTGSIVVVHGPSCFRSMWGLSRSGVKLVYLALAGRFFTPEPPEKPSLVYFYIFN